MPTPHNHYLTLTDAAGNTIRGRVIDARRLSRGLARIRVETQDVLPSGEYDAVYATTWQEASGTYKVDSFAANANLGWISSGVFVRAKDSRRK